MILSRRVFAHLAVMLAMPLAVWGANAKSAPGRPATSKPTATYKSAIVIDAATGNVLLEENADVVTPPASMTKLMTFAVLHDHLARKTLTLATPVKIDPSDTKMGGTQVFLDPRETFTVEELIWGMMIQSANDAAHALSRACSGTRQAFVEEMNAKAAELGMKNTKFRTPHGLPPSGRRVEDGDLTTARDYAILSRHLIRTTDVLKYTSVAERQFGAGIRAKPMDMVNHNKLVGKVAGVDGLKTGFTDAAGYCLSATAERKGRRVILVIMGALGPGGQRDLGRSRDQKAIELLERGFTALPSAPPPPPVAATETPGAASSPFAPAPVTKPSAPTPAPEAEPTIKMPSAKRK